MHNDGQTAPEDHFQPAAVAFQSNRKIRRDQMKTDFIPDNELYVPQSALAKIHRLIAVATVGTYLNPNAY
jgi:hypothetical protein